MRFLVGIIEQRIKEGKNVRAESLINTEQETKNEVGEVAERPEWLQKSFEMMVIQIMRI